MLQASMSNLTKRRINLTKRRTNQTKRRINQAQSFYDYV